MKALTFAIAFLVGGLLCNGNAVHGAVDGNDYRLICNFGFLTRAHWSAWHVHRQIFSDIVIACVDRQNHLCCSDSIQTVTNRVGILKIVVGLLGWWVGTFWVAVTVPRRFRDGSVTVPRRFRDVSTAFFNPRGQVFGLDTILVSFVCFVFILFVLRCSGCFRCVFHVSCVWRSP